MEAMDARRLRLYELLKPRLGEEGAKELVLRLPARPETLATKADLEILKTQILDRMDARSAEVDARFAGVDVHFAEVLGEMNARFGEMNGRLGEVDAGFGEMNGRIAQLEATLTRRMVAIMGAWTVLLASTAAWASTIFG